MGCPQLEKGGNISCELGNLSDFACQGLWPRGMVINPWNIGVTKGYYDLYLAIPGVLILQYFTIIMIYYDCFFSFFLRNASHDGVVTSVMPTKKKTMAYVMINSSQCQYLAWSFTLQRVQGISRFCRDAGYLLSCFAQHLGLPKLVQAKIVRATHIGLLVVFRTSREWK